MAIPEDPEKLRMANPDSPEHIALHLKLHQREVNQKREADLEQSLGKFRVGSVKALNTVPLTRGLEDQITYATPAKLAELLQRDELDAALVSVVEPLLHDRYDILDGVAVASLGEVKSVLLAHRQPLDQIKEIYCDTASLTSVRLLKVLLAERGLQPEFKPLADYDFSKAPDNLMLIGDPALDFLFGAHDHEIMDLGAAWYEMTNLPFVYAVWALRRGGENSELRRQLHEAKDFGMDTLDTIIRQRPEYTEDFRKDYFGWHLHYHLGSDERRGIAKFMELMRKHGLGPVYEPRYVF